MTKRNVALLGLVLVLALSTLAFALVPSTPDAPAPESSTIASLRTYQFSPVLKDPACPPASPPGCGGG